MSQSPEAQKASHNWCRLKQLSLTGTESQSNCFCWDQKIRETSLERALSMTCILRRWVLTLTGPAYLKVLYYLEGTWTKFGLFYILPSEDNAFWEYIMMFDSCARENWGWGGKWETIPDLILHKLWSCIFKYNCFVLRQ